MGTTKNGKRLDRHAIAELAVANPHLVAIARKNGTVRAFAVDGRDPVQLAAALEHFYAVDDCKPVFIEAAALVGAA